MISIKIDLAKVDAEEIIREFQVTNADVFAAYMKEDLVQRSDDKFKGVNKITFAKYYELPGIISERFYSIFDRNNNNHIDAIEFVEGMKTLFTGSFEKLSKLMFDLYDFDKDGFISKEDIRTVLSYVPLNTKTNYRDRIESQEELFEILEQAYKDIKTELINYEQFVKIVENVSSDIYFFILIFLLEKRPFSNQGLAEYEKMKKGTLKSKSRLGLDINSPSCNTPTKMIASPNCHLKLSPSRYLMTKLDKENVNVKFQRSEKKNLTVKENPNVMIKLLDCGKNGSDSKINTNRQNRGSTCNLSVTPNESIRESLSKPSNPILETKDSTNTKKPIRKQRTLLRDLMDKKPSDSNTVEKEYKDSDNMIIPAIKKNIILSKLDQEKVEIDIKDPIIILDPDTEESNVFSNTDDSSNNSDSEPVKFEGYLYKLNEEKKLKKIWFKLFQKDFYYFKSETDQTHQGMHNLSGTFVKEEKPSIFDNVTFHCFSVSYPKKVRFYYTKNEEDVKKWVKIIKQVTGYSDLLDIYEVRDKLGNGKFGLVKLGINKKTGEKVAIKIMSKKEMKNQDLELLKTEIEILRICQHPNIIRLIDIFENLDYVYAIIEYCSGGDLFSYIEKRTFKLTEQRACQIIHKLSTAIYYLHSYGIAHRDIKPENILMTNSTDEADIRLLDFGLSKIIGPTENCTEPYGTLSYVAPEVLLEKPYSKAVDLWSIGVTSYLLLAGVLPFDHQTSEREIARMTIQDSVKWGSVWKKLSSESKDFVDNLLQKDPSKRMTIKDVLNHPWIQKFQKSNLFDQRRKSMNLNDSSSFKYFASTDESLKKI